MKDAELTAVCGTRRGESGDRIDRFEAGECVCVCETCVLHYQAEGEGWRGIKACVTFFGLTPSDLN